MGGVIVAFKGEHIYSLDEKGRVKLPPAFRDGLLGPANKSVVLLRDPEGCLGLYSNESYAILEAKLATLDLGILANRQIQRCYGSSAMDINVDVQGRIMIPAHLLEYAQLAKNSQALFAGFRDSVQVWSKERYDQSFLATIDLHSELKHQLELR